MVRIEFNQKGGIVISILLFIFCAIGAMWLAKFRSDAGNEGARVAGVWIVSITGVVVPLVILAYGASERRKGDLMRYFPDDDVLEFPRMVRSIENAKQRVYFSSEHYTNQGEHFFELDLVVDGERIKFLSSNAINGFRSITKPLEAIGFAVNHQRISI